MIATKYTDFLLENRIKMKIDLPEDIYLIKNEFSKHNKKLYVVGGFVRDWIEAVSKFNKENGTEFKRPISHDIDLVTDALPEESKKILKGKFRVSEEQGKNFGVLRIYTESEPLGYELATFRLDISKGRDTKGNDKKVDFGSHVTIEDDVKRRDLTQNALFYDIDKEEIVDLVDGVYHIKQNIISAVGDPVQRFNEDRLRILRSIRFASRTLANIDKKTSDAIMNDRRLRNISDIDDVSQERIFEEFKKTVDWCRDHGKTDSLMFYLKLLKKYHLFEEMFPDVKINIEGIDTFDLAIIFALLFRNNIPDRSLESKLAEFKISNSTKEPKKLLDKTIFLIQLRNNIENIEKIPELNKKRKQIGIDYITIKKFFDIEYKSSNQRKFVNCFLEYDPKISGKDLIAYGIKGVEIGNEIRRREIEDFQNLLDKYKK